VSLSWCSSKFECSASTAVCDRFDSDHSAIAAVVSLCGPPSGWSSAWNGDDAAYQDSDLDSIAEWDSEIVGGFQIDGDREWRTDSLERERTRRRHGGSSPSHRSWRVD